VSPSILSGTIVGFTADRRCPGETPSRAFEPPFRSQAPRCARSHGGPANLCQRWRRAIPGKASSHHRTLLPRLIAQWIGAQHGWSIVIDNRSGAAGIIGVVAAKQAPADGHTLVVVTTSTHGSMPALKRNLAYDAVKDFAPIVLMADAALVLLVRDELPVRSVAQLVEMMREQPGRLNYSTGGYGSPHHLATMTLFYRARHAD
jgi:hypothetical protein